MTRVLRFGLILLLALGVQGGLHASAAAADACSNEEFILWSGPNSTYGDWNTLQDSNRDVNTNCGGLLTGSTSHIALGNNTNNGVETGWEEDVGSNTVFKVFTEYFVGGNSQRDTFTPSCFNGGSVTYQMWKTTNVPGGDNWTLYFNCLNGTGWINLKTYSTLWQTGTAETETWRYGGTATGMSDDQTSLRYKDSTGNWTYFTPACNYDIATNWDGKSPASHEYSTYKPQTDNSPPSPC